MNWISFDLLQPNCQLTFDFMVTDGEYIYTASTDHETWYCDGDETKMTHWMSFKQIPLPDGTIMHHRKNKIIHNEVIDGMGKILE